MNLVSMLKVLFEMLLDFSSVDFDFFSGKFTGWGTFPIYVFKLQVKGTTHGIYAQKENWSYVKCISVRW